MFPLTAYSVVLVSSGKKSLPFSEAMHYVLYCSKVNTHTRIYTNNPVAGKKEKSCHRFFLDSQCAFTEVYSLFRLEYNTATEKELC